MYLPNVLVEGLLRSLTVYLYDLSTKINNNVITVSPQIQRPIDVSNSGTETANFGTPKMRVIVSGPDIQYSVGATGLYSFSVKLEETLS